MIDFHWRPLKGTASDLWEQQGQHTTRLVWRRVCEECEATHLIDRDGDLRCGGCYRRVDLSPRKSEG